MNTMKHIRVEREGAVGILTIDRRERLNSLDVETAQDFRRAGLQLARDRDVRAVVIRGEGGVFCSGADLKYIRDGGDQDDLGYLQPEARASPRMATGRSSSRSSSTSTARSPRSGERQNHLSRRSTVLPRQVGLELR